MAGNRFKISSEGTAIALVAATAKTVLGVNASANVRLKLKRWGIYFDGTSATAVPVIVQLLRTSSAGTSTAVTPRNVNQTETVQATAGKNYTAEPTAGDILENKEIHPQQGYETIYPEGGEVQVAGGGRLTIKATAPAGVNCVVEMEFEE